MPLYISKCLGTQNLWSYFNDFISLQFKYSIFLPFPLLVTLKRLDHLPCTICKQIMWNLTSEVKFLFRLCYLRSTMQAKQIIFCTIWLFFLINENEIIHNCFTSVKQGSENILIYSSNFMRAGTWSKHHLIKWINVKFKLLGTILSR